MSASEAFIRLRDLLAAAYPAERDLRRLAGYAKIDLGDVEMRGRARPSWEDALLVAARGGRIDALRQHALLDAKHPDLRVAFDAWAAIPLDEQLRLADQLTAPPPPALDARHTLRAPVLDFTGRVKEIEKLVAELTRDGAVAGISGVRGMGGIGKTELALVVADRLKPRYPDAQLMFELQPGGAALPPEALAAGILRAFAPAARLPDELPALLGLIRSQLQGQRGLLLFDNAAGPQQVAPLLPPPPGWAVIVTTRERFALPGARFTDLEVLRPEDALTLLRALLDEGCRSDLLHADLAPLAGACGYLPLALRVAASYLCVYPDTALPEYLHALSRDRLGHLVAPGEPKVEAVLRTSVDRLAQEDPALAEKWRWLAVFPAPFDRAAVAAVWGVPEEEAAEGLRGLLSRSLVSFDTTTRLYSLHDLLRDVAHPASLPDEVIYRHAWRYFVVSSVADRQYHSGGENVVLALRSFDTAWPHLWAAWEWMQTRPEDHDSQRWLNSFPSRCASELDLRLTPPVHIRILGKGLAAARALGDHYREGIHLRHLGTAYRHLSKPHRAIEYYEQALGIAGEIGDRLGEGNALVDLGIVYLNFGELHRAVEYASSALSIAQEIGALSLAAGALGNLGNSLLALGKPRRALEYYTRALRIHREVGDRRGEGIVLSNMGIAHRHMNEPRHSAEYCQQSLAVAREIGDQRAESDALSNLGLAYADFDEPRRAIEHFEQALVIDRNNGDRRGEGQNLRYLGNAYIALADPGRAIRFYEKSLVIAREIGDQSGEANTLTNMSVSYEKLGELSRGRLLWEEALRVYQAVEDSWVQRVRTHRAELDDQPPTP